MLTISFVFGRFLFNYQIIDFFADFLTGLLYTQFLVIATNTSETAKFTCMYSDCYLSLVNKKYHNQGECCELPICLMHIVIYKLVHVTKFVARTTPAHIDI